MQSVRRTSSCGHIQLQGSRAAWSLPVTCFPRRREGDFRGKSATASLAPSFQCPPFTSSHSLAFWQSGTVVNLLNSSSFFPLFIFSEILRPSSPSLTWSNRSGSRLPLNLRPFNLSLLTARNIGLYRLLSFAIWVSIYICILEFSISENPCRFINLSVYTNRRTQNHNVLSWVWSLPVLFHFTGFSYLFFCLAYAFSK